MKCVCFKKRHQIHYLAVTQGSHRDTPDGNTNQFYKFVKFVKLLIQQSKNCYLATWSECQ